MALMAANVAVMASILWLERVFDVPQISWLGVGNALVFLTLLMAADIVLFMHVIRIYGLQRRGEPDTLELLGRVAWYLFVFIFAAVFCLRSSDDMERFFALVVVVSGLFTAYFSAQDVVKRTH